MNLKLNKIISYLILSDLVFYSGWGLISPIFAIYILDSIVGGTAFVVGMSAGINLVVRSLLRVPFGILAERSQRISFHLMFWGLFFAAFVPIGYIYSTLPIHLYLLQAILGASLAMSTAGWTCLYSRHLDHGKESTQWGIDAVAVGLGPGIAGMVGGAAVTYFSFTSVFLGVTIAGLIGVLLLLIIKSNIIKNNLSHKGPLKMEYELRRVKKARLS